MTGLLALTACGGGGGPSVDTDSPEWRAFEMRQGVMHIAEQKVLQIRAMANGEEPMDEAVFAKATADLAAVAGMMLDGFETQVIVAESRAEPAIFDNWADAEAKAAELQAAATQLAEAAATGGFAAAEGLVQGATQNCSKSCHSSYRGPEQE
ncbi:MAG: cytochrome c [Gammaproteobacteria bacterium]|nr:cytochrome c [Gammaproteobacteria bacterium]